MARNVAIGIQDFGKIIKNNCFYVDKTDFIREWWESGDDVTLINRPRRFGKTLNMSMVEHFFPWITKTVENCSKVFPYGKRKNTGNFRELIRSSVCLLQI